MTTSKVKPLIIQNYEDFVFIRKCGGIKPEQLWRGTDI